MTDALCISTDEEGDLTLYALFNRLMGGHDMYDIITNSSNNNSNNIDTYTIINTMNKVNETSSNKRINNTNNTNTSNSTTNDTTNNSSIVSSNNSSNGAKATTRLKQSVSSPPTPVQSDFANELDHDEDTNFVEFDTSNLKISTNTYSNNHNHNKKGIIHRKRGD